MVGEKQPPKMEFLGSGNMRFFWWVKFDPYPNEEKAPVIDSLVLKQIKGVSGFPKRANKMHCLVQGAVS